MYNKNVVIISCKRTAIGIFGGGLSSFTAPNLGSFAIRGALANTHLDPSEVEEVIMGQALQAGSRQAPARQAALEAGLPKSTSWLTINKGWASGMKSVIMGTQMIASGWRKTVIAGGMESMSGTPHYIYIREPITQSHMQFVDSILYDAYIDNTDKIKGLHLGNCAEKIIAEMGISREVLEEWTKESYERAKMAQGNKVLEWEIVDIVQETVKGIKKINQDEEWKRYYPESIPVLRPIYSKNGTLTAACSSKLSDGASAIILMEEQHAKDLGLKPIARILGYQDSSVAPIDFTIANFKATEDILEKTGMKLSDIDFHEIHETYASVPLANIKLLDIDPKFVNVNGGAVALGHPLGMSGNRIIISLLNVLRRNKGTIGLASICNGGGGASAVIIERLN